MQKVALETVEPPAAMRVCYDVLRFACVLSMITYLDRVCNALAAPAIVRDLDVQSVADLKWVFIKFARAYALFEVPSGWMSDAFGLRNILICIVLWWSVYWPQRLPRVATVGTIGVPSPLPPTTQRRANSRPVFGGVGMVGRNTAKSPGHRPTLPTKRQAFRPPEATSNGDRYGAELLGKVPNMVPSGSHQTGIDLPESAGHEEIRLFESRSRFQRDKAF